MLTLLTLLACAGAPEPAAPENAPVPVEAAPAQTELKSVSAAELAEILAAPSDKPRVVNFWATWCAPCIEELPRLREWGKNNGKAQLILVDLDLPQLREKKVLPFIEKYEIGGFENYQVSDKDPATAMSEAVPEFKQIVPFTLLIPTQGGLERTAIMGSVKIDQIEKGLAAL